MAGRVPSLLVLLVFPSSCLAFRSPLSVFKRFKETTRPFSNECLGTTRPVVPIDSSDFALDIRMPGVTPKQSDTYFCMSMRIPVDEEAFVIDFKPRASMDTVHHMLLFGCNMPSSTGSYWFCDEGTCTDKANILYAWARNAPPTRLPKGVGFRVGGETGSKYFVLQVHYGDISAFRDNNKDCSGVSLHLTRLPQPLIAGMYLMMSVDTVIPAGEKVVNSDISCHYKNYPMHVFAYRVHTHHLGKVVSGYRVRNGQWTLIGRQSPQLPQAFYPVGHPVDVSFGDLLAARCVFTGEGRTEATHIGGTSSDEMCNLYIMYYMEAKHAVSFMTCTQNVAPDMFRTIPPEANIPIPVKSDMVMMHEHHKETEYKDKIPLLQQPKREEEEVLDQDFHMEEALDWPGVYLLPGQVSGVALDPKNNLVIFHRGDHVWDGNSFDSKFVYQQIGLGPIEEDTILVIDPNNAAVLQSSGKNLFYLPHGLSIDKDGNYWVTDVALHQVFKLDPNNKEGPVLILGRSMQPGSDQNHFCQPTDVAVDPGTGAIYVSDGYCNSRIVQFSPSGKFITQWGEESSGSSPLPGQFTVPHSLALVPLLGQLCVADRENGRIQCFKTDTKEFVREIKHSSFGRNVFAISYIPGLLFAVNGKPHFGDQEPVQGFVMNFSNGEIIDIFKPVRKHFDMPHDIVASEDGTVYIGDAHTNTVWKFTLTEKLEHRSVKKAGIEVQEIKEAEAVVETKMENKPTSSELQKMQEKQKLIKEPGSGVPVVLITTLLVIPVVVLLAIAIFIRWKKSRAFGDSEHKLETSSGRVLGRFRGKGSGGLNLGNFFASRKGYSRKGFDRLSTEGSDQEKEDDGSESEEEYSAPLPALAPSSS
ncbi:peptidylglycine alpha-amidating monooxygenase [Homo sapiens]|uniref:Isoform 2 of Peptidyl-glycine alpha-amidating monooxygenase n=2 Tax=Homo sapiens TaxID=9606 RepID=P19021-2|nr:peptidyl-glycine alpha-amidating monooxygenase isoform c precursor [Homo sapiens]XP_024301846.1 peptidyl-glycine alpha-amidating monooxygenase isoform X17 [Homo sapiens]XP_047273200.1 peptidyl-glycine alpha-amidating monooxygenase isoform X17 [Homo sapiens]XP_054208661.1 peptidyl-glycine alpha-amidating monooxygenase isoform X17 [Homo sapiens]XP_054208662.1 peptidyl-glycine alpha-amidating monooxygenase isoform X17 [Homo sapiens]AAX41816.1 peptidylglycine alpha-amidating monooxygenase [synt|eukprot:NP_620176.1 peptidyl-glycine alpha-amidating monooxygenase isoform c precursor [Homo sapiens]